MSSMSFRSHGFGNDTNGGLNGKKCNDPFNKDEHTPVQCVKENITAAFGCRKIKQMVTGLKQQLN
jgi:hypothetical protein